MARGTQQHHSSKWEIAAQAQLAGKHSRFEMNTSTKVMLVTAHRSKWKLQRRRRQQASTAPSLKMKPAAHI